MSKGAFISILVAGFLVFWIFGMVTSLASSSCVNGLTTPERTDKACWLSEHGLAVHWRIGQPRKPSDARLFIGYAVASLRAGDMDRAEEKFRIAYEWGSKSRRKIELKSGYKIPDALLNAVARIHMDQVPKEARAMWWEIVSENDPDLVTAFAAHVTAAQEEDTL